MAISFLAIKRMVEFPSLSNPPCDEASLSSSAPSQFRLAFPFLTDWPPMPFCLQALWIKCLYFSVKVVTPVYNLRAWRSSHCPPSHISPAPASLNHSASLIFLHCFFFFPLSLKFPQNIHLRSILWMLICAYQISSIHSCRLTDFLNPCTLTRKCFYPNSHGLHELDTKPSAAFTLMLDWREIIPLPLPDSLLTNMFILH